MERISGSRPEAGGRGAGAGRSEPLGMTANRSTGSRRLCWKRVASKRETATIRAARRRSGRRAHHWSLRSRLRNFEECPPLWMVTR